MALLLLVSIVPVLAQVASIGDGSTVIFDDNTASPLAFITPNANSESSCQARVGTCFTDNPSLGDRVVTECSYDNSFGRCICNLDLSSVCDGGKTGTGTGVLSCTNGVARCNGNFAQECVNGKWVTQNVCSSGSFCEKTLPGESGCFEAGDVVARDPKGESEQPSNVGVVSCATPNKESCETVSIKGETFLAPSVCGSDGILRNKGYYCDPDASIANVCDVEDGVSDCYEITSTGPSGKVSTGGSAGLEAASFIGKRQLLNFDVMLFLGVLMLVAGLALSFFLSPTFLFLALAGLLLIIGRFL